MEEPNGCQCQFCPTMHLCFDRREPSAVHLVGVCNRGTDVQSFEHRGSSAGMCWALLLPEMLTGFPQGQDFVTFFFFSPINLNRANTSLLTLPTEPFCSDMGPVRTDQIQ